MRFLKTRLLFGFFTAVLALPGVIQAEDVCMDFAVSPEPVVFTEHPRSGSVSAGGDEVVLRCAAVVKRIGGFVIEFIDGFGEKNTWRQFKICWLYHSVGEGPDVEYCSSEGDVMINSSASENELTSELKIVNMSATGTGFYSCYVEDWRMRYTSYQSYIHVQSDDPDNSKASTVVASMGEVVEMNCSSLFSSNSSLTWFHNNEPLPTSSDRYTSSTPSVLRFNVTSVTDEGSYECVSSLEGRHSMELKITAAKLGITVTSSQNRTHYYNGSSTLPLLACRSDPDHEEGSVWYEWYINGSRSDTHNSSVKATTGVQTYVCYTHHKDTSLSITYRVLPYGCVNPVVGLQYPSATVARHNKTEFSASMKFCWEKPDHLGGLKENELQYQVVLENNISLPDSPLDDVIVKKLCYEGTFTTLLEITSVINIKVAAFSLHNQSSQDTIIPSTSILGWVPLDIKDSCGKTKMSLLVRDPVLPWLPTVTRYSRNYHAVYMCRNERFSYDVLRTVPRATFEYGIKYPFPTSKLNVRTFFVYDEGNSIVFTKQEMGIEAAIAGHPEIIYPDTVIRSCAILVYPHLDYELFRPHVDASDYRFCDFEDPPRVSLMTNQLQIEKGQNVTVQFVIIGSDNQSARQDFEMELRYKSTKPREGYSWSSGIVLRGEEDGEFSFILPDNLTRDGIKFLNFSLHVPKIYKDVVELGNVSNIMIELTEPPTTLTEPTTIQTEPSSSLKHSEEVISKVIGVAFLMGCFVVGIVSCLLVSLQMRIRQTQQDSIVKNTLTLEKSTDYWITSFDITEDTVTQYDYEFEDNFVRSKVNQYSSSPHKHTTEHTSSHDSAYVEDGSSSSAYEGCTNGSRGVTELDRGFPQPSQPEYISNREPSTPRTSESYVPLLLPPENSPSLPVKTTLSFPIKNTAI